MVPCVLYKSLLDRELLPSPCTTRPAHLTLFLEEAKMVSKLRRQESTRRSRQQNEWSSEAVKGKEPANSVTKKDEMMRLHKVCKFKRSCFDEEEEATCSAILLLACVVCDPSTM